MMFKKGFSKLFLYLIIFLPFNSIISQELLLNNPKSIFNNSSIISGNNWLKDLKTSSSVSFSFFSSSSGFSLAQGFYTKSFLITPNDKLKLRLNSTFGVSYSDGLPGGKSYNFLPSLEINYKPNDKLNLYINLGYDINNYDIFNQYDVESR